MKIKLGDVYLAELREILNKINQIRKEAGMSHKEVIALVKEYIASGPKRSDITKKKEKSNENTEK